MTPTRREFVAAVAVSAIVPAQSSAAAAPGDAVTPEMFGAKGDGRTNDTQAFAAMSAHVNARGGGTIVLRRTVYIVGQQHPGAGGKAPSFTPVDIIRLQRCTRPVIVEGNGATLRAAAGIRYGRFDPVSGKPLPRPAKRDLTNEAVPFGAMIDIKHCSGSIEISDLELDGNLEHLWIGGPYGKGGWEAGGSGLRLRGNSGPERLTRIHAHHLPTDGIMLAPSPDRSGATIVTDVVCEYNARQGCSLTGGRNLVFQRCKFRHTGKAVIHSKPGDGVDIEAEGHRPIRNVAFLDCEFSDNTGFGVGAGRKTDASDIRFAGCKFIGTTNWAGWLDRAGMRFDKCLFVGSIVHVYGDTDPAQAAQFTGCTFTDDPKLSPTGQVYLGPGRQVSIAVLQKSPNVRFSGCRFRLVGDGVLPLSAADVIYADCDMAQRSPAPSRPVGTYLGTTIIHGNADLAGSAIRGKVTLNGRVLPRGR